ncbi:MAG: DUF58 domain-containing protein [Candidatus Omnitrophica bacterium]|jgi:uncharacterized protein (DUF58 family)|nr:DUF58 domain-containing protein [Candidatus Omnitrophota bacterium]
MIPKEVLREIRRIQITTSRMVTDVFSGQYQSVFKGRGMEFDEVREYQVGDEIRSIDWNVTARMGHPYIKKFMEERELTVMLLLDLSGSSYFGTVNKLKRQIAAEICSVLAFSAIRNNDKVGLIIFTDKIEKFVPAKKGISHVLRIIREALYFNPQGRKTDIPAALEYLNKMCKRSTVTFIVSDFYDANFEKPLSIANKRHDLVSITITDPKELDLPNIGMAQFDDPETGKTFNLDTSNEALRRNFRENALRITSERKKTFDRLGVDNVDIRCDIPYNRTLFKFFRMRERRLR